MSDEAVVATSTSGRIGAEAVSLLGELIRHDTSNPPGAEREPQEMLAGLLSNAGFECEFAAREPERPNLIARLRGQGPGQTLCLLGHVDTVLADREEWSFDPWSGDVVDGAVRGRGALDMKGQVAAEVAAAVALGREGWRPSAGELLVVVTADEEMGGGYGARWLCAERPDLVRCDLVINEGGGLALDIDGRRLYTLCLGEKGVFRFKLRTRGVAGHASTPKMGENALIKLAPLIARMADQPPYEATPEGLALLSGLLGREVNGEAEALVEAVEQVRAVDPAIADFLVEPVLGVTLTPTKIQASAKGNVIPSMAEALVDCRVPPGSSEEWIRERVNSVLGEGDWEIEFGPRIRGNRSPAETPLAEAIAEWVAAADPGAGTVPIVMPGFSDSHWFRQAFGSVAYGFLPQRAMPLAERAPLIHGADERIPAADLELASDFFYEIPRRVLG